MPHCQECMHYKATNDGPYCFKSSGHPKPISPIMVKDCFEERPAGEPASTAPAEKPGYVPRTKVCAKCGRELPLLQFSTNRRMKDGHQSECKECVAKAGKKSPRAPEREEARREGEGRPGRAGFWRQGLPEMRTDTSAVRLRQGPRRRRPSGVLQGMQGGAGARSSRQALGEGRGRHPGGG